MTKFTYSDLPTVQNTDQPVLYKIGIGNKFYVHKGKDLEESLNRFLEDVFRGMRGKSCPAHYSKVVQYCIKYPAINKVGVSIISNGNPDTILKKESQELKAHKDDDLCLNRSDLEPYKPEWMVKQALQERCEKCVTSGFVSPGTDKNNPCYAKKQKFQFCPNCGRLNK